ncbi:MAG: hypothetical protein V4510_03670 [bacterium]
MALKALLAALAVVVMIVPVAHASAGAGRVNSSSFGLPGAPRFDAYALPDSSLNADNAGEPTIGIPWNTNSLFFQAFTATHRAVFSNETDANGAPKVTWTDVTPAFSRINVDPMLYADHVTNRVFQGGLDGPCSVMGLSDDDGKTWLPSHNMCNGAQLDHQSIGSGPWPKEDVLSRSTVYPRATYYCSQLGTDACATSPNGGMDWLPPAQVTGSCGSLHGHIKVSEADGFAILPNGNCGGKVGFGFTNNGGITWDSRTMPDSKSGDGFDPSAAFSTGGWLYLAQANIDGLHVALSKDDGASWQTIGNLTADATPGTWLDLSGVFKDPKTGNPIKYGSFPDVVAGDNTRVAISFLGTTNPDGKHPFDDCSKASDENIWHYYLAESFDAGSTWSITRLSEDPVQIGAIWNGGGGDACRNLLDFADMQMDSYGRLAIGFADGCLDSCAKKYHEWVAGTGSPPVGSDSRHAWGTVLRQTTGLSLFAMYDKPVPVVVGTPPPMTTEPQATPGIEAPLAMLAVAALAVAVRRRA